MSRFGKTSFRDHGRDTDDQYDDGYDDDDEDLETITTSTESPLTTLLTLPSTTVESGEDAKSFLDLIFAWVIEVCSEMGKSHVSSTFFISTMGKFYRCEYLKNLENISIPYVSRLTNRTYLGALVAGMNRFSCLIASIHCVECVQEPRGIHSRVPSSNG